MREITTCLLCGRDRFEPLVQIRGSVTHQADGPRVVTTFMVCRECGFVFQNPTLEETDLAELYGQNYRTFDPPSDYQQSQAVYGQVLCEWVERRIGPGGRRRVLDIGCAAGFFLGAFRQRGWDVVGIDANPRWVEWGRHHLGLDLRTGFFDEQTFPGEQFDLILFSHVLEHLPDPEPTLRAIRAKLRRGGYLFIGAPNVFLPPKKNLQGNFMARPHVCLYSPRTVQRVLAKAGLQVAHCDNWYPRGMRVLAQPAVTKSACTENDWDDWKTIHHLYAVLTGSSPATTFGRNLASLVPSHYDVLEAVAAKSLAARRPWNGMVSRELVRTIESGRPALMDRCGDPRTELFQDSGECLGTVVRGMTVVMIGLGAGWAVQAMVRELKESDSRLVVCEPDSALVRTVMAIRDLTDVLESKRVRMMVGPQLIFRTSVRKWLSESTDVRVVINPWLNEQWRRRYQPIESMIKQQCLVQVPVAS